MALEGKYIDKSEKPEAAPRRTSARAQSMLEVDNLLVSIKDAGKAFSVQSGGENGSTRKLLLRFAQGVNRLHKAGVIQSKTEFEILTAKDGAVVVDYVGGKNGAKSEPEVADEPTASIRQRPRT